MKITPDTGILVRMSVKAAGPARRLLDVILEGPHELELSEFLLEEMARVLRYPRMRTLYRLGEVMKDFQLLQTLLSVKS